MTRNSPRLIRTLPAGLAALATFLTGCREAAQVQPPEYCRYADHGPLCDLFDPAALPYAVALGLKPLDAIAAADRPIVRAFAAAQSPAPASIRVLAPVEAAPAGRRPFDRALPQRFPQAGNPRVVIVALGRPGGRVDLHSLMLVERRLATSQRLAAGLQAASLRGLAANGWFNEGFSVADRAGSLGDLYRLGTRVRPTDAMTGDRAVANLAWTRIAADSPERKLDWFRQIVNHGSCAGAFAPMPLLLAPVPEAWIDEYERTCPLHPPRAWLRPNPEASPAGNAV